jgi:hypothetical protein
VVTKESKGFDKAAQAAAVMEFRENFLLVEEGLCAFSEAIDPEYYQANKKHFDFMTSQSAKFAEQKLADF